MTRPGAATIRAPTSACTAGVFSRSPSAGRVPGGAAEADAASSKYKDVSKLKNQSRSVIVVNRRAPDKDRTNLGEPELLKAPDGKGSSSAEEFRAVNSA
jgi:hypothetical protein